MKKCKLCPRKKVCKDNCYEEWPCEFAAAFDKLGRKIERLEKKLHEKEEVIR